MRAARTNRKIYALGAVAVAALLSSTACGSGGADGGGKAADSTAQNAAATSSAAGGGTSNGAGTDTPGGGPTKAGPQTTGRASGNPGDGDKTATEPCTNANISITATAGRQDEGRHLLLTATNTGTKACTLYHYPNVVFGAGGHDPIVPMESPSLGPATIKPGEKAYSGLFLWRAGEQLETATSFTVGLQGRVANTASGNPIGVRLPDGLPFVHTGPSTAVLFWNRDGAAINKYLYAR